MALLFESIVKEGVSSIAISMDGTVVAVGSKYSLYVFVVDMKRMAFKQI